MDQLNLNTQDAIALGIWIVVLAGVVHWGHTFRKKQRDLIGNRKFYFIFSTVLLLVALCGFVFRGLNFGLDFTGGTVIEIGSPKMLSQSSLDVSQMISKNNPTVGVQVQLGQTLDKSADGKEYQKILIRAQGDGEQVELQPEQTKAIVDNLKAELNDNNLVVLSETSIGPTISYELKRGAVMALLLASFLQLLYITFRFGNKLRYGTAAVISVFHDSFIMVGFYALAGLPVDSSFVSALLTIAGYSVMDTVVIFDRIRENRHNDEKSEYSVIVNRSVNETMTRSVNTTLTTLIVCIALYFFGGVTLKAFAYALIVGVVAGAYSSIFLASPLVVEFDAIAKRRDEQRKEEERLDAEERATKRSSAPREQKSSAALPKAQALDDEEAPSRASESAPQPRSQRRRVKGMRR